MAGTEQPKPVRRGTTALPGRPIRDMGRSSQRADWSRNPLVSSRDRQKNSVPMAGRKDSTLPTPAQIPSTSRALTGGETERETRTAENRPVHQEMPRERILQKNLPGPPKVRKKTSPMAAGRDRYRSAAYRFMESVYAGGILTELTDFRKSPVRIL